MAASASETVRRWIDEEAGELPAQLPAPTAALAQALKDEAMAAWGTTPALALRCATLLGQLRRRADCADSAEVGAMADWAAGLASLTQGRLADAAPQFDAAHDTLLALGRAHEAAQTRVPKLIVLSMLGRHDEALACGEAALAGFVAAGDERSAGKIELNLGTMLFRQDRHADACRQYRSAAVRFARAQDVEHSVMADINMAHALTSLGDFDEGDRAEAPGEEQPAPETVRGELGDEEAERRACRARRAHTPFSPDQPRGDRHRAEQDGPCRPEEPGRWCPCGLHELPIERRRIGRGECTDRRHGETQEQPTEEGEGVGEHAAGVRGSR